MGVKGLWQLLDPTGRPVTLESLEGKVLAVDVSIWLNQTVKGMRDAQGNPLPNAHLLGLFNRVCKLLFYRIKPVFVFDGGVPYLKRRTLAARKQKKQDAMHDSEKATQKMLQNLMKHHALRTVVGKDDPAKMKPQVSNSNVIRPVGTDAYMYQLPPSPERSRDENNGEEMGDWEHRMEQRNFIYEQFQSLDEVDLESDEFKALPPEIQHEILTDLKQRRKYEVQSSRQVLPEDSKDFSNFQLKKLMKQSKLSQKIDNVVKELNSQGVDDVAQSITGANHMDFVESRRVVSEDSSHYILIKGLNKLEQHEKHKFASRVHGLSTLAASEPNSGSSGGTSKMEAISPSKPVSLINMSSNIVDKVADNTQSNSSKDGSLLSNDDNKVAVEMTVVREKPSPIKKVPWSGHKIGAVLSTGYISEEDDDDDCMITGSEDFSAEAAMMFLERSAKNSDIKDTLHEEDVIVIKNEKKDYKQKNKSTARLNKDVHHEGGSIEVHVKDEVHENGLHKNERNQHESGKQRDDALSNKSEAEVKTDIPSIDYANEGGFFREESDEDSEEQHSNQASRPLTNNQSLRNKTLEEPDPSQRSEVLTNNQTLRNKTPEEPNHSHISEALTSNQTSKDIKSEEQHHSQTCSPTSNPVQKSENLITEKQAQIHVIVPPINKPEEHGDQQMRELKKMSETEVHASDVRSPPIAPDASKKKEETLKVVENDVPEQREESAPKPTAEKADAICISEVESNSSESDDDFLEVDNESDGVEEVDPADAEYPSNIVISDEEPMVDSPPQVMVDSDDDEESADDDADKESADVVDEEVPFVTEPVAKTIDVDEEIAQQVASQTSENAEREEPAVVEQISQEEMVDMQDALTDENRQLMKEQARQQRIAATVTEQMSLEAQELLALFGLPFIVSPMEAEAQCAELDKAKLTQGTITDDSDIWLFGGQLVYKNFFNQNKQVEVYRAGDIRSQLMLDREAMINIALLCGSDYTDGVEGIGPVGGMEVLGEFQGPGLEPLRKFKDWWEVAQKLPQGAVMTKVKGKLRYLTLNPGFPSENVVEAYLKPVVDSSDERFSWSLPDLDLLRAYAREKFGWRKERTDELLLPVMKNLNKNQTQQSIMNYFLPPAIGEPKGLKSKRVKHILQKMRNQNQPSGTSENSATSNKSPASSPEKAVSRTPEKSSTRGRGRGKRGSPRGIGRTPATVRQAPVIDVVLSESSDDSDDGEPVVKKVTNQASKRPARSRGGSRSRGKRAR